MKNSIVYYCLLILFLSACKGDKKGRFLDLKPSSTGGADEIMFVFPDYLNTTENKKLIHLNFSQTYRKLPSAEAIFTLSSVNYGKMNGLMYRFRSIVMCFDVSKKSEMLGMAKNLMSKEDFTKLENNEQYTFFYKNVWSKPQNVIFIFGNGEEDLNKKVKESASDISKVVLESDMEVYKKVTYIDGINQSLKKQWKEFHAISLDIPSNYKMARNEGNFVLLRKDIKEGLIFLMFDVKEYNDSIPDEDRSITYRDELGRYVSSDNVGSFMKTDHTDGFIKERWEDKGIIYYETSGLWRMENDFMGGPFISRYIIDNRNKRVVFLDGMMFAPGEDKKKRFMKQVEVIFNSLEIE